MKMKPKVLLGLATLFLVAGGIIAFTNTRGLPSLNVIFPLGVILAGAFLVVLLFEKESKIAVDDQQRALDQAGIHEPRDKMPARRGSVLSK